MKKILKLIIALSCIPFFSGTALADTPAEYGRYNFAQQQDFERLAFGFPQPIITIIPGYTNGSSYKPVVILAGGYDPTKDYIGSMGAAATGDPGEDGSVVEGREPTSADIKDRHTDRVGNAIYFVDAMTGDLVARVIGDTSLPSAAEDSFSNQIVSDDMKHSIAATITPVDSQGDGITDRIYFIDIIGNIFRLDLIPAAGDSFSISDWNLNMIASLGTDGVTGEYIANDRRFFHQIDVVRTRRPDGKNADALMVGSGNIALPKQTVAQGHNAFYMIYDYYTAPASKTVLDVETPIKITDLVDASDKNANEVEGKIKAATGAKHGWYLPLLEANEKVVSASTTVDSTVYFTTIVAGPDDVGCQAPASLPSSHIYGLNIHNASAAYVAVINGMSQTPVQRGDITQGRLAFQQIEPFVADGGEVSLILPDKKETLKSGAEDRKLEGGSSYWRTIDQ